jgi:hypothetical protein
MAALNLPLHDCSACRTTPIESCSPKTLKSTCSFVSSSSSSSCSKLALSPDSSCPEADRLLLVVVVDSRDCASSPMERLVMAPIRESTLGDECSSSINWPAVPEASNSSESSASADCLSTSSVDLASSTVESSKSDRIDLSRDVSMGGQYSACSVSASFARRRAACGR